MDSSPNQKAPRGGVCLWLAAATLLLLLILVFRAAFGAYFVLDDFGMLAIVRFLDNPFEAFFREHIPGGLYYRPLGMLFWWLSERAFGTSAVPHYLINLLLHAGVAAALWGLLGRLCENRWVALVAAAIFALHPIGVGTTLWLSDRFDLLALLSGLLGLRAALAHSRSGSLQSRLATLALLGCSLLSKEIALACFCAAAMLWLYSGLAWAVRLRACAALLSVALGYVLVRMLVLSNPGAGDLLASSSPLQLFFQGMTNWTTAWLDYSSYLARMDGWKWFASITGLALLAVTTMAAMTLPWRFRRRQAVLAGATLFISTALLQWPLLGHFSLRMTDSTSALDLVVNARYYYVSLAGALTLLSALISPQCVELKWGRWLAVLACVLMLLPWLSESQRLTRSHREQTREQKVVVEAAVRAIAELKIPSEGCQIYLLDTTLWSFGWISDEAVKAMSPDLERISGCLIQTEHTPWYHIASIERTDPAAMRPLSLVRGIDESIAMRPIGNGRFLVLNLSPGAEFPEQTKARFLSWQGVDFTDITEDVLQGRRKPDFVCNRQAEQCPE
jgi:hypothetical protein